MRIGGNIKKANKNSIFSAMMVTSVKMNEMKIIAYIFIALFGCVTKPLNRVVVHSNCGFVDPVDNSNDALADMNLFVMKIEESLRKENISLEKAAKTDFCGFFCRMEKESRKLKVYIQTKI